MVQVKKDINQVSKEIHLKYSGYDFYLCNGIDETNSVIYIYCKYKPYIDKFPKEIDGYPIKFSITGEIKT
jgi:hypothetical protein